MASITIAFAGSTLTSSICTEDADTAPGGVISPSFGFETTSVFAGEGRLISIGGYVGVDFTVTEAGSHEVTAWVWGYQGGVGAPRAVLLVEQPSNETTTWGANAIRDNLAHLHWQLLGERVDAQSAAVADTYQLFLDTWNARIAQTRPPYFWNDDEACRLFDFSFSGELNANSADPIHGIRTWQAVLTALLGDYRFLHE